jgi:hypothetical protein
MAKCKPKTKPKPKCLRCADCRFARIDSERSTRKWQAIECENAFSEFHKSLINVSAGGARQNHISWSGCEYLESKECRHE